MVFLLIAAKGDLETRANSWGLPSYNGTEPCTECKANRTTVFFTDLRPDAVWRSTVLQTSEEYIARASAPRHPLLASEFIWLGFTPLDAMHVLDCNGLANIVAGGIVCRLIAFENRSTLRWTRFTARALGAVACRIFEKAICGAMAGLFFPGQP